MRWWRKRQRRREGSFRPARSDTGSAPSPSGKDRDALLHLHGDFRLGCCNSLFAEEAAALFESLILSPELILPQIRDIPGNREVIVYGRLPLMLLEKPVGTPLLRDRKGSEFPILREGGRELLINSLPLYMADRQRELAAAGIRRRHFLFTVEGPRETEAIIDAYRKGSAHQKGGPTDQVTGVFRGSAQSSAGTFYPA